VAAEAVVEAVVAAEWWRNCTYISNTDTDI